MSVHIRYVKRLLMAFDFATTSFEPPTIPNDFFWKGWAPTLIKTHAQLVHIAFSNDLDGRIFPTFRQYDACEHLVRATASVRSFVPEATWLIGRNLSSEIHGENSLFDFCAAIQCVRNRKRIGEIQNVSVHPSARRLGLGRALVLKALEAFENIGVERVTLEVTAENAAAVRMYDSLGFRTLQYFYTESFVEPRSSTK